MRMPLLGPVVQEFKDKFLQAAEASKGETATSQVDELAEKIEELKA